MNDYSIHSSIPSYVAVCVCVCVCAYPVSPQKLLYQLMVTMRVLMCSDNGDGLHISTAMLMQHKVVKRTWHKSKEKKNSIDLH